MATITSASPKHSWRRWFQFRLRTLMLVFTFVAVALGLWVDSAWRQKQAVQQIRRAGGSVTYASCARADIFYERRYAGYAGYYNCHLTDMDVEELTASWWQRKFGIDFVDHAIHVSIPTYADEIDLSCLRALPRLEELSLESPGASARKLSEIGGLKRLRKLTLRLYGPVDDADLEFIRHLPRLNSLLLGLSNVEAVPAGLEHFAGLTQLELRGVKNLEMDRVVRAQQVETLVLDFENHQDQQLARLAELPNLTTLHVEGPVDDEDLRQICRLNSISDLCIRGATISDASLPGLQELTHLCSLEIESDAISDQGLEPLANLEYAGLERFEISGPSVTEAGLAKLQFALFGFTELQLTPTSPATESVADPKSPTQQTIPGAVDPFSE